MSYPQAAATEEADSGVILFRFAYRSIPCRVVMDGTIAVAGAPNPAVVLRADMGILPFTGDGPSLRSRMLAVLDQARRMPGYGVRLTPGHGIGLSVALAVDDTAPPASILAAAIGRIAEAKPLFDVVLSLLPTHLRHRPGRPQSPAYRIAESGTANTCPG